MPKYETTVFVNTQLVPNWKVKALAQHILLRMGLISESTYYKRVCALVVVKLTAAQGHLVD